MCSETPSRLKGIETRPDLAGLTLSILQFRNAVPFEGNRNLNVRLRIPLKEVSCSETPSRLKGIETRFSESTAEVHGQFRFRNAFPFEGNRNHAAKPAPTRPPRKFRNAVPVEGNRNPEPLQAFSHTDREFRNAVPVEGNRNTGFPTQHSWQLSSETPSRLKGIETSPSIGCTWTSLLAFRNAFPVEGNRNLHHGGSTPTHSGIGSETPSRLKGIETTKVASLTPTPISRSETPSRLKGIETL